jgi:hypothetical protein
MQQHRTSCVSLCHCTPLASYRVAQTALNAFNLQALQAQPQAQASTGIDTSIHASVDANSDQV